MAVANGSSSAMVKVVLLPLMLVLLAMAAGASSMEDEAAVAKSGGRFSETPVGRKLLALQLCGLGSAPDYSCKVLLPLASNPKCCTDAYGNKACWDVGAYLVTKCGSCNTACKVGEVCCKGVCANLLTANNNCGICGNKCLGNKTCKYGFCGYGY